MKKKSRHSLRRLGSVAGKILGSLAETERHGGYAVRFPWIYRNGALTEQYESEIAEWMYQADVRRELRRLEQMKLLHIDEIGGRISLTLTDTGRFAGHMEAMRMETRRLQDTKVHVSFDVPERVKSRRELLVRFLKRIGMKRLHASLWATDKDIREPLRDIIRHMKAEKWVRLYEAKEISID